jgi:hypothetical protein
VGNYLQSTILFHHNLVCPVQETFLKRSLQIWLYNSGFQHFPCLEAYTTTILPNKGTGPIIFISAVTVSLHDKFPWQESCFHNFKCESPQKSTSKSPFTLLFWEQKICTLNWGKFKMYETETQPDMRENYGLLNWSDIPFHPDTSCSLIH